MSELNARASRPKFTKIFGPFLKFLQKDTRREECFFLSDIVINETQEHDIQVEFRIEYGPVGYKAKSEPDFRMFDGSFCYVFGKDGSYKGKRCTLSETADLALIPAFTTLPSYNDFPYEESMNGKDALIDAVFELIERCSSLGVLLNSIQIRTFALDFKCSKNTACDGRTYSADLLGVDLLEDITKDTLCNWSLQKSRVSPEEYDLVCWVTSNNPRKRSIVLENAPKRW